MEYKGFVTSIKYSEEDKVYYGSIENITDLVAFHSETVDEFENYFKNAVDEYIDFCKEIGKPIMWKK